MCTLKNVKKGLLKTIQEIIPNYGQEDYDYMVGLIGSSRKTGLFEIHGAEITTICTDLAVISIFEKLEDIYHSIN